MTTFDKMNEQEQMNMLMSQLQDSNLRQSVLQHIQQTASGLKDGGHKTLIETLARESVHHKKETTMWKSRTKKSMAMGVVAVVLAITVQFLVNYFTNELSKESHVNEQGAMVSTAGQVVKTQMEEMKVGADGRLLSRDGDTNIKTTPVLAKAPLASSLPDAVLMGLDEIVVHSDKGHTLQIKVHGFSRIPVLNSRCGNIVHFYTAWKGKVTLDSTDLSFDEATAAEFAQAGFGLASGGRRLQGGNSLDGFFKSINGMKESGKWTCADVPLPTMPETSVQEVAEYSPCRGLCESRYGKRVYGAEVLTGTNAHSVIGRTSSDDTYLKTSSTRMTSASLQVQIDQYPQHPGQQRVRIFNKVTDAVTSFQFSSGRRSHCSSEADQAAGSVNAARADPKIDTDVHFEYLGMVEELGLVLRHFRMMPSKSFVSFLAGPDANTDLTTEFWDVADTLQVHRLLAADGTLTVINSMSKKFTEDDMSRAVNSVGGSTACSADEMQTRGRPTMVGMFDEVTPEDVDFYLREQTKVADGLAEYFSRVLDETAVPDSCYDQCKSSMDRFRSVLNMQGEICDGSLAAALACMAETAEPKCQNSHFVAKHYSDCLSTNATRELRGEEEVAEPELLVNSTGTVDSSAAVSESRNLLNFKCNSKNGVPTPMPDGVCMEWTFKKFGFKLTIKWGSIGGKMGLALTCQACVPILLCFSIPPPLYAKKCTGGSISVTAKKACPDIPLTVKGKVYWNVNCGADFGIAKVEFAKLELGIEAGVGMTEVKDGDCKWVAPKKANKGRRRLNSRRRNIQECNYKEECDVYVKGYVELTILIAKARVEFTYWVKSKKLEIWIKIFCYEIWKVGFGGWKEMYSSLLGRYWF